jgi:hypothetical protein
MVLELYRLQSWYVAFQQRYDKQLRRTYRVHPGVDERRPDPKERVTIVSRQLPIQLQTRLTGNLSSSARE